nr:immunoglobulin heavy chain junction region [Mus musculus]
KSSSTAYMQLSSLTYE